MEYEPIPPDQFDLSHWPTITEAAAALRTSTRSVLRAQDRGEIEIRKRQRVGKKPENVVNPDDLRKLIEKEAPRPFPVQLPAIAPPAQFHPEAFELTVPALTGEHLDRFLDALRDLGAQRALPAPAAEPAAIAPAVPLHIKLWLTLEEAAAYSGYSARNLRRAIENGCFSARRDGPHKSWILQRASLEEWCSR